MDIKGLKLITVKELSELTGIKCSTLYLWAERGVIPHYRLGRLIRFSLKDIENWLNGLKKEGLKPEVKQKPEAEGRKLSSGKRATLSIDEVIRKTIDEVKGSGL